MIEQQEALTGILALLVCTSFSFGTTLADL